jgi:hypothetical protein
MARAKKKKTYRNLNVTQRPEKKHLETKEIVLTLTAPNGDVVKIEALEKSGQRRELNDDEFSALAGNDAIDLGDAVEQAYATGIADALQDDEDDENEDEAEILRRFILKVAAGRQLLRRGAHKLIVRRALHRQRGTRHTHQGGPGRRAMN